MILRELERYSEICESLKTVNGREFVGLLLLLEERRLRHKLARSGVSVLNLFATESALMIIYGPAVVERLAVANDGTFAELKNSYGIACDVSSESCSEALIHAESDLVVAAARFEYLKGKDAYHGITKGEYDEIDNLYRILLEHDIMPHFGSTVQQALMLRDESVFSSYISPSDEDDKRQAIELLWEIGFYRTDFITGEAGEHERDLMLKNPDWREMARSRIWLDAAADAIRAEDSSRISMAPAYESDMKLFENNQDWVELLTNPLIISLAYA